MIASQLRDSVEMVRISPHVAKPQSHTMRSATRLRTADGHIVTKSNTWQQLEPLTISTYRLLVRSNTQSHEFIRGSA